MNDSDRSRFVRFIDRAVAMFSPNAAVNREIARQRLHQFRYAGAVSSRDRRQTTQILQGPETPTYTRDRIQLMREARNLEENGQISNAVLGKFDTHVTGKIRYQPETGSKRANDQIREWWKGWSSRADYTNRHSFRKMVQIALRSALTDGDCGIISFADPASGEARLIGIEGDRIGNPYDTAVTRSDYVHGILLDGKKAPSGFEIFERPQYGQGQYTNPEVVPAENFCHLANPNRFDRYRGVTIFAPVIETGVDIEEIVQFEKLAVKWGSMQTGVVTGQPGGPPTNEFYADGEFAGTGEDKQIQEIAHGQLNYVSGKDAKIEQFKTERPGAAWEGFLQFLIHLYAAGVNLPYGFVFDIAMSRGPGARFEAEQARRTFELWQETLVEKVLDRIKNMALITAVANGDISPTRDFLRGSWQFPSHPSIDVGRESKADVDEVAAGIKSQSTVLRKYSLDAREERERIGEEMEHWLDIAKRRGIPPSMLPIGGQTGGFPPPEPAQEGDDDDDDKRRGMSAGGVQIVDQRKESQPAVNVRTAPVNVNLATQPEERPKVKKEISFIRKNGKVVGANVLEVPESGQATKRKVVLSKDRKTRIDGNDVLELPS